MSLNELQEENTKLQVVNTNMGEMLEDMWNELDATKAENAKLRELVQELEFCRWHESCVGCKYHKKHCPLTDKERELGIV